ncbi:MAG TPA: serine hydrolase domain-containing protein [Methylomirabilota bacterium]|jgi:CubicO group peptidase (beta-lactamase class C family)|nr:serine hydrolase domain-containing protein [Methylomirabilota bacterium]
MLTRAEEVGLSSPRLKRLTEHWQRYVDAGKLAGALTLIARRGKLAYCEPIGHLDLEGRRPVTPESVWRIYSMTKPIVSVGLMMLYEQGRFQLEDPVHRFIPSWKNLGVYVTGNHPNYVTTPPARAMTIRDLLTHTAGLTYGFLEHSNVDAAYRALALGDRTRPGHTVADLVEKLAAVPLEFSPGTRWNYSVATDIVGHLIEVISGQTLDAYLNEQILQPLGMHDTGFVIHDGQVPRFAANHERQPDGRLRMIDDPARSLYRSATFLSGGGGLVSTALDYYRFAAMLLNGGELDGIRILGRKTVQLMTLNHLPGGQDVAQLALPGRFADAPFHGLGFGLGFSVVQSPARAQVPGSAGAYAWSGAASTHFWVDPTEELIVIFMTQLMPSSSYPIGRELRVLSYAALID